MPLTPTDVANKQFKIAFRGYSLDEVDQFLDEVETELTRLLRDNNELQLRSPGGSPAVAALAAAASSTAGSEESSTSSSPPSAAEVAPAPAPLAGMEGQEAALRTLLLAQRTADQAIAEARAEAEEIVSSARAEAEDTLGKARAEAESTLARSKAEADSTLQASRTKAEGLDADIAARIQAATGDLDERRRALEARIEELRAFEREYRTRLKAYLETQLRDLGSRQGPDDGGVGVPAGARSAAVGPLAGQAVRSAPPAPESAAPHAAPTLRAVPTSGAASVGPFSPVPAPAAAPSEDEQGSDDDEK